MKFEKCYPASVPSHWRGHKFLDAAEFDQFLQGPVPLRALEGLMNTSRDAVEVVYVLACEGIVTLDLCSPLDDRAIVRAAELPEDETYPACDSLII
jgi:hypothetical protein